MNAPAPYPFELADEHFSSGVNHPGEVVGLGLSGGNVGITASEIRPGLLEEIATFKFSYTLFFVDSGAFSEVEFGPEGRKVVRPITDAQWRERLALYRRMCTDLCPNQVYPVAPDCVGDQVETLRRLEAYAGEVRALVELGANVIVPCQKGAMPLSAFFRAACEKLQVSADQVIAGVPMKKDATTVADLTELCESFEHVNARIHLLGLGPESKRYEPAVSAIAFACPWARITSDSVTIRRLVGRTNGRGGGPRALTLAQDQARAAGLTGAAVKSKALIRVGRDQRQLQLQAARRAGWFDPELESAPGVPLSPGCINYGPGGPFGTDTETEAA